jgi:general secretion pathway protein G
MCTQNQTGQQWMERNIKTGSSSGFTILELMIVMTIIAILVAIAIPMYQSVLVRAKETVLMDNQRVINEAIDQYTADKKKAPQTLQDLIDAHYFREIPIDPITNSRDSWVPKIDTGVAYVDQTDSGLGNVCSGSSQASLDGSTYNTWGPNCP